MNNGEWQGELDFLAAVILLGLNLDDVTERSAICEYDGGLTRQAANVEAVFLAMRNRSRTISRRLIGEFIAAAGAALEAEHDEGWSRSRTIAYVVCQLQQGHKGAAMMMADGKVA